MAVLGSRNGYLNKAEAQWTHAMKTRDAGTHQRKTSPRYNSNMDLGPEFVIEPQRVEKRVALSKLNAGSPSAAGANGHQQNGRRANAGCAKSIEWNRSQCEYH